MTPSVFLFPGQGSQSVGMGLDVAIEFPEAKATFEEADRSLGESLTEIIRNGPEALLKETVNAQPAILTVSVAIGRVLMARGIRPSVLAGHSLGEYSALVIAGALEFRDAVRLVRLRGRFMQEVVPLGKGTMAAVLGMSDEVVEEVCEQVSARGRLVEPANYNCPGQLVISGITEGVEAAVELLKQRGCKRVIPLPVSAPFHCSLLKPAGERLADELEATPFRDPEIPYVANVDGSVICSKELIVSRLIEQVWRPVRWTQSLERIFSEFTPACAVEVGPGRVVSGHVKKISPETTCHTTESIEALRKLLAL